MARSHSLVLAQLVCALALASSSAFGADANEPGGVADLTRARAEAAKTFKDQVSPFLKTYCGRCHTGNRQRGGVTFESVLKNPDGSAFRLLWKRTAAQVATHDMPPEDASKQPNEQERKAVLDWIAGMKRLM